MSVPVNDQTLQWDTLVALLDEFIAAWSQGSVPPRIEDFLTSSCTDFRAAAVVELVKIDLQQRYRAGQPRLLEQYASEYPELLLRGEPPSDLIFEEFHVRKMHGQSPDMEEYFRRFPNSVSVLRKLLASQPHDCSTSIAANMPPADFEAGEKIDDFVLITRLGAGAFATVYLARQQSMQRMVALKISANTGAEGETLAQLDHPHIIRVFDQRRLPERKLRLLYMQFAPGGTLKEVIDLVQGTPPEKRTGELLVRAVDRALERAGYPALESSAVRRQLAEMPWAELVCRIGMQLAQALQFAHDKGVLHRDVKPANVLLSAECSPKLADFNVSFASSLAGVTAEASFGGSLSYMSPEQLEVLNPESERPASSLDGRSDLFSLAALLWELLYGVRPFDEQGLSRHWSQLLAQICERRRLQSVRPPHETADLLTRDLTTLLLRGLQPDREARPASGEDFARELQYCLHPRTRQLMEPPHKGFCPVALRWPLVTVILLILIPNGIAGATNYIYNQEAIRAINPRFLPAFGSVAFILNVFYFSLGAVLAKWIIGPTAYAVWRCERRESPDAALIRRYRLRSLRFGSIAAMLGVLLWVSSGIAFPFMIRLFAPEFPWDGFRPFFASMPICGLIAAAYPFFGVNFFVVRILYPALLRAAPGSNADETRLRKLSRGLVPYLAAAGVIPLLIMLLVVAMNVQNRLISGPIILAGLIGLAMSYLLYHHIRDDIAALLVAVRPLDAEAIARRTDMD